MGVGVVGSYYSKNFESKIAFCLFEEDFSFNRGFLISDLCLSGLIPFHASGVPLT